MPVQRFLIECPYLLSLRRTALSHGWVNLAPWSWKDQEGLLSRSDSLASGGVACIQVSQESLRSIRVAVEAQGAKAVDLDAVRALVSRWLSLAWDPGPAIGVADQLNPRIAEFIREGGGRFLKCSTFFEDFAKTICTIHAAWSGTQRMVTALIDQIGEGLFPTPSQVLDAGETALQRMARLGFRARVLFEVTQEMLSRGLIDESGQGDEERITYEEMLRLRGIGPYAASHLAMLLQDYSRIPVDSEVRRFCNRGHGLAPDEIESFFEEWGAYRFLGYKIGRMLVSSNWIGD